MLKLHVSVSPRLPNFQVKVYVSLNKIGVITEADQEELKALRTKLEQIIPGNLRIRYNLNIDQLVLVTKAKSGPDAQRVGIKLSEFVRSAATALQMRM